MASSLSPLPDRAQPSSVPPPPPSNPSSSRRLPPPCWSNDETAALIHSYREKWYSLRRGNLKATHWQEVADAVASICPIANPPKTSVQCRHKMEKLRKRYRTELQRTLTPSRHRKLSSASSWIHFGPMHAMEKGPVAASAPTYSSSSDVDLDDDDGDDDDDDDNLMIPPNHHQASFGFNRCVNTGMSNGSAYRVKFPGDCASLPPIMPGIRPRNHENPNPNSGSREFSAVGGGRKRERSKSAVDEMVEAVKLLGDGFVRMEKMKMEMAKEIEAMRMEMENKRSEMILESQHRIVEAFAKGLAEKRKKKVRRLNSPQP